MSLKLATPGHKFACLFMKGEKTAEELDKAQKRYNFTLDTHQSITDNTGKILYINNLSSK